MSRAIIGGVVAVVIVALTAVAYFVTTFRLESRIQEDERNRIKKAQELLVQNSALEQLKLLRRVDELSRFPELVPALKAQTVEQRNQLADDAFLRYRQGPGGGEKTDVLALLGSEGELMVLHLGDQGERITNPRVWLEDIEVKGGGVTSRLKYAAFRAALQPDPKNAQLVSDIFDLDGTGLMKVGAAPVIDNEEEEVIGAVVVAYAIGAKDAREQSRILGAEVAYFEGSRVHATSFVGGGGREDTAKRAELAGPVKALGTEALAASNDKGLSQVHEAVIDGSKYLVTAGRLSRFSSQRLPAGYPGQSVGAMVLVSLRDSMASVASVKASTCLLGLGALIISLLALTLQSKRFVQQTDELELGINEITSGNLEHVFRSVGAELDGLANALNVMLARLLGRPEPGEEEYDDEGNVIRPHRLHFDTDLSAADSEAVALAQEPEPDYYKRLFGEYIQARQQLGHSVEGVTFEGFVTKIRVTESNLKAKYQSSAIRFRVAIKDDQVLLKPIPVL